MLKAPWRRFLDIMIQTCLGRQDFNGVLGKQNDLLGFLNGQWGPVQLSSLPGGNIGLDFVFAPGQPQLNNRYPTEATLWTAIDAAKLVTAGPLGLAIDSSAGAATFVASHNWLERISLYSVNHTDASAAPDTLTLADGAVQTGIAAVFGIALLLASTTGPVLAFPPNALFVVSSNANVDNVGTVPACTIGAGGNVTVLEDEGSFFTPGGVGTEIFSLTAAGASLRVLAYAAAATLVVENNLVRGIVGTNFTYLHDASRSSANPNFLGTLSVRLVDVASEVGFSTAAHTALLPLGPGGITQQQATEIHYSPTEGLGANSTVDANQLDQSMVGGVAALVYTIPAGFPVGRELTFTDASAGAGGNAFTLTPTAPEEIGAAGAGTPVVYTQVVVKTLTIKKTAANTWRVISSTTLV